MLINGLITIKSLIGIYTFNETNEHWDTKDIIKQPTKLSLQRVTASSDQNAQDKAQRPLLPKISTVL